MAAVAPLTATIRPDGDAEPIDPPHHTAKDWLTAAWITQSSYPAAPATGPSYIYGHACHHHICAFTALTAAHVGDAITVTTPSSSLHYRICGRGLSPKTGNPHIPTCGSRASVDIALITCQYEQGDTSTDNLIVTATLTTA